MILAVGTSPAWQRTLEIPSLCIGTVNRASAVHECAAGKAVNVAVAAHRLGERSRVLTTSGGRLGQRLADDLSLLGVERELIPVATPTRVCTTLLSDAGATELVEPAGSMSEQEVEQLSRFLSDSRQAAVVVFSGSLARGVSSSLYAELGRFVQGPVVVDASGPELLASLEAGPLVVKPSRGELERTLGCTLDRERDLRDAMGFLVARGARWVVLSDGGEALWAFGQDVVYRAEPPRVSVVNPIGSGDCLAAGIACGISRGLSMQDAVRLGMACAAANLATVLPARFERDQCMRLLERVRLLPLGPGSLSPGQGASRC
ncbi:MAG: 1-phosphofructokinase family hexose kinase [Polyangiaceae bacterium]|nr:1-phosphofructokinase family hexose kinase [Polyangiaceae bacterium]